MKRFKEWAITAGVFLFAVGIIGLGGLGVAMLIENMWHPKTYAAICSGQQYKFTARSYRLGPGGCVTFQGVGFVCGCNLVVEVKEEAKK
jgi:hypothetical protein